MSAFHASSPQSTPVGQYAEYFPGSPAVCGHGNREFSFLARRGSNTAGVIVAMLAGGTCWDAAGCALDAPQPARPSANRRAERNRTAELI